MTSFPPTPEQELILEAAVGTRDNLLIQALAGAAKTSTLVLIAKALPGRPILSVAFNKRIADEMNERLPSHCVSKTLNSIGHTAWSQHTGKKLTLDQQKTSSIIRGLDLSRSEQDLLRDCFSDVVQLVAKAMFPRASMKKPSILSPGMNFKRSFRTRSTTTSLGPCSMISSRARSPWPSTESLTSTTSFT
jgi:hypothetical protein